MSSLIYVAQVVALAVNKTQSKLLEKKFNEIRSVINYSLTNFKERLEKEGLILSAEYLKRDFLKNRKNFHQFDDVHYSSINKTFNNLAIKIYSFRRNPKPDNLHLFKLKNKNNYNKFYLKGNEIKITTRIHKRRSFIYFNGLKTPIKIFNALRFPSGHIIAAYFKKDCEKYYVSLLYAMAQEDFLKSHTYKFLNTDKAIGIDLGLKTAITISCGLAIDNPLHFKKSLIKLKKMNIKLARKRHPRSKGDTTKKSNNFLKMTAKLRKFRRKIFNKKEDYLNKVVSILIRNFAAICIETLDVKELTKKKFFARKNFDICFAETLDKLKKKINLINSRRIVEAPIDYPSTKLCVKCDHKKENIKLSDRIYECTNCGLKIDRDLNAASNLFKYMKKIIGYGSSKLNNEEFKKLEKDLKINKIQYNFVELPNKVTNYPRLINQSNKAKISLSNI